MCAPSIVVNLFVSVLIAAIAISMIFHTRMVTEGLPSNRHRQEHGTDAGVLAGADFLSFFVGTSHSDQSTTTPYPETTATTTTTLPDTTTFYAGDVTPPIIVDEQPPTLVAEANKSDFSVEESEPITADLVDVKRLSDRAVHRTVVFHDSARDQGRARAVSYSAVVQTLPAVEKNRTSVATSTPPVYGQPEQNYEVDESASVMTNGRVHGVQTPTPPKAENRSHDDSQKVGYVVEGRNYRKYRVEERTSDGFIVGEYGVVSHDDGSLRGVRYTADGTINPRLIYDALMKFLAL